MDRTPFGMFQLRNAIPLAGHVLTYFPCQMCLIFKRRARGNLPPPHTHNDCPWKPLSYWLTPGANSGGCMCSPGPLGTTTSCPPPSYKGCLVVNNDGGPQQRIMAARWSYSSSNPPLACYNVNIKGRNKSHT